jgi:hypothetical protein
MFKHFIRFAVLIAVCSLAAGAGAGPQKGKTKVNVSKIMKTLDKEKDPTECRSPRPKNRGCNIACKPCLIPVCEDGKWKYERIEILEEECRPHQGDQAGVCSIGISDPCPAECKKCIRQ